MKKRTIALLCAAMMVVGIAAGGTLAWLVSNGGTVTNTFTSSDISIELTETTGETYKMVPGYTIEKDPTVTVKANSEKSYLFVELEEQNSFDEFMTYEMAVGWTELTEGSGIYYRVVDASTSDQPFAVLKDDQVVVKDEVTKADMDGLSATNYPKLIVSAYASQYMKNNTTEFTADEAWANANSTT